jgi:hypothetical protein
MRVRRDSRNRGGVFVRDSTKMTSGEHLSEQLKAEIKNKYNIKTNIIGPAACSMAMHLEFSERAQKTRRINNSHGRPNMKRGDDGVRQEVKPPQFAEGLLYGGQGKQSETSEVKICTVKQMNHHAGSHKIAATDTAPSAATVNTFTNQPSTKNAPTTMTGLEQLRLGATREAIMGETKIRCGLRTGSNKERYNRQSQAHSGPPIGVIRCYPPARPTNQDQLTETPCVPQG